MSLSDSGVKPKPRSGRCRAKSARNLRAEGILFWFCQIIGPDGHDHLCQEWCGGGDRPATTGFGRDAAGLFSVQEVAPNSPRATSSLPLFRHAHTDFCWHGASIIGYLAGCERAMFMAHGQVNVLPGSCAQEIGVFPEDPRSSVEEVYFGRTV